MQHNAAFHQCLHCFNLFAKKNTLEVIRMDHPESDQYLNQFFEQLGMLPTPFSLICVLQMLIGYSTFLINIYLGILVIYWVFL